jgi:pimeloyl-ACP methyl ester carboxylesterase
MTAARRFAPLLALAAPLGPVLAQAAPGPVPAVDVRPHPCKVEGIRETVRCATHAVWEDRAARRGRKIGLNVVILPATGPDRAPDPVVWLAGGPGEGAAVGDLGFVERTTAELRRRRDVLLVDQRGTGRSNPLACELYGPGDSDVRQIAGELFPDDAVRRCRTRLEKVADLTLYTTPIAMDDLDDVRAWLGYDKVDLFGGSYGTRAAQVYMKRHGERVRSAVLVGVAPLDEALPTHHAYAGQRAVDLLFAECAADAACHAAYPRIGEELREVMARVDRGVKVAVADPETHRRLEVQPSRGLVAEGIRYVLYEAGGGKLPGTIDRAYHGDLAPLVTISIEQRKALALDLADGMYLSVTCAEDIPFLDPREVARLSNGTLLGDYRVRVQQRACALWPRAPIPADLRTPLRSDVPALLVSGERDPVTPPEFGERVMRGLPNGRHVVIRHGGHGSGGGACLGGLVTRFVERGSAAGLDASCLQRVPPPRFATGR